LVFWSASAVRVLAVSPAMLVAKDALALVCMAGAPSSATGIEISPKKSRHAAVLQLYRADDGSLVAKRSTDLRPTGGMAQAPVDTDAYAAEAATGAAE
jgi:hypothetical protein